MSISALRRLDPAGYRRTPWKNGGGVTIDIADRYEPGAEAGGWSGTLWRFGRTAITVPAPFSDLSGLDRIIAVVSGRGLVLRRQDSLLLDVREPFRPVRFAGEWPLVSVLEDGPVEVVNLLVRRGAFEADLVFLGPDTNALEVGPGHHVVYAPEDCAELVIVDGALALAGTAAAEFDTNRPTAIRWRSGRVAIASVRPCPAQ